MSETKKKRKPAQLEMVGGKGSRQRAWEALRKFDKPFTTIDLMRRTKIHEDTLGTYLRSLELGGFLEATFKGDTANHQKKYWNLIKDNGMEAPRLTRDGKPVQQGQGNESMWRAMRMMSQFNARELAAHASTSSHSVTDRTAQSYVKALYAAGYLTLVKEAVAGQGAKGARYRLAPSMNTGPRPPMIQRTKSVYDPNTNKVVWKQEEKNHDDL